jgi:hypothetical protein
MLVFDTIVSSKKTIFPENYQSLSVKIKTSLLSSNVTSDLEKMTLRMKLQINNWFNISHENHSRE